MSNQTEPHMNPGLGSGGEFPWWFVAGLILVVVVLFLVIVWLRIRGGD